MKMWKDFRGHSVIALGLLATAFVFVPSGNATLIPPNTATLPITGVTVPGGGAVVASILNDTISTTAAGDTLTVTYSEWVYQEAGGSLDFIIQANNDAGVSNDIIDRVTSGSFQGNGAITTDLGFNSAAPVLGSPIVGGLDPTTGDRSANGATVGFDFGASEVAPGGKTDYLIIKTNATKWVPGTVSFQDGVTVTGAGFGVVPEPGSVGLLLGGLFGVGLFVTRRFRVQQS